MKSSKMSKNVKTRNKEKSQKSCKLTTVQNKNYQNIEISKHHKTKEILKLINKKI